MIYLCSVYSLNADEALMEQRYHYAMLRTAKFMKHGYPIFSPIVHCHEMAKHHDLPKEWEYWQKIDFEYLKGCKQVWVLMMPGWEQSVGVQAELRFAKALGLQIEFIECKNYVEDTEG